MMRRVKEWAHAIRRDVGAVWLAAHDTRTPWLAKIVAFCVAAYALSPIDLIPDFIPVLGYLDDLILVPLGVMLAVALLPEPLMREFRARAEEQAHAPQAKIGIALVILTWIAVAALLMWWFWPRAAR
jgi:uncharacterized membrane protein YkvA (DUF1232 family)